MYGALYRKWLKNLEFMLLLVKIRFYIFYILEEWVKGKIKGGRDGAKHYLQRAANSTKSDYCKTKAMGLAFLPEARVAAAGDFRLVCSLWPLREKGKSCSE